MVPPDQSPVVVVVGDIMVDVMVRPLGPLNRGSDTPSRIVVSPGGSAANQAVAFAAAGAQVHLVAVIGDDELGRAAASTLRSTGVELHIRVSPRRQTGIVVAVVDSTGKRSMLTDRGANLLLDKEMLGPASSWPGGTSTFRATSCSTTPPGPPPWPPSKRRRRPG